MAWSDSVINAGFMAGASLSLWTRSVTVAPSVAFVLLLLLVYDTSSNPTDHTMFALAVWVGAISGRFACVALHVKSYIRFSDRHLCGHSLIIVLVALSNGAIGVGYSVLRHFVAFPFVASGCGMLLSVAGHYLTYRLLCTLSFSERYSLSRRRRRYLVSVSAAMQMYALAVAMVLDLAVPSIVSTNVRFVLLCGCCFVMCGWAGYAHTKRQRWRRSNGYNRNSSAWQTTNALTRNNASPPDGADSSASASSSSSGKWSDCYIEYEDM